MHPLELTSESLQKALDLATRFVREEIDSLETQPSADVYGAEELARTFVEPVPAGPQSARGHSRASAAGDSKVVQHRGTGLSRVHPGRRDHERRHRRLHRGLDQPLRGGATSGPRPRSDRGDRDRAGSPRSWVIPRPRAAYSLREGRSRLSPRSWPRAKRSSRTTFPRARCTCPRRPTTASPRPRGSPASATGRCARSRRTTGVGSIPGRSATPSRWTLLKGLKPFMIIANVGTTNTGAVDGIEHLLAIGRSHSMWVHADAAYGGFFRLASVRPRTDAPDRGMRLDHPRSAQGHVPALRHRMPARPRIRRP